LQDAQAHRFRAVVPDRLAQQGERTIAFHEEAPTERRFRFAHELVRRDQEKKIGASVTGEFFELATIAQLIL
jgi:hypothetical protein